MKTSIDRILTTHVGSLPRPEGLLQLLIAQQRGAGDEGKISAEADQAVMDIVREQVATGIDVVNDGEMSKFSYALYIKDRLNGVSLGNPSASRGLNSTAGRDLQAHPDYHQRFVAENNESFAGILFPICNGPISYGSTALLERDLDRLAAAQKAGHPHDVFMTAASPGVLARFVANRHYKTEDAYLADLADAMRVEYEAIVKRGFVLQIDCPDMASSRNTVYQNLSDDEFVKIADRNIEMLNHATRDLPPEAMRMHICWGNYEGPHNFDIEFHKIAAACFRARPAALSFEGANPRHEHEWEDWARLKIPDDKILIPGVIDSTSNFVEHPRLVAQRIGRYANIVGRDRVIAGGDCGFGTFASKLMVAPTVVWSKLKSLAEGARMASADLWRI